MEDKDTIFTGETSRDALGKGGIVNPKHGGGNSRDRWEGRLAARLDKQKQKTEVDARKFTPRSVVMSEEKGKIYTVNGVVVTKEEYDKAGERSENT